MPLGVGNEHLSSKLHAQWEREIERRQARRASLPQERAAVLTRAVQVEERLAGDEELAREERKKLRVELAELLEDAEDLRREAARIEEDLAKAQKVFRLAVEVEGQAALEGLAGEMDKVVDELLDTPASKWAARLDEARLVSALAMRWLNSAQLTVATTRVQGNFLLVSKIPCWDRPSRVTIADFRAWLSTCQRGRSRLADEEEAR